jgi:DNA-binding transcriptional ArsR family regulator
MPSLLRRKDGAEMVTVASKRWAEVRDCSSAGGIDLAAVGALIGNTTRASMLNLLSDGRAHRASELAKLAGVTPSTASAHLVRLLEGGLVAVERAGRCRYYRLADARVAAALEALAIIALDRPVHSLRVAERNIALRFARACYDHLAGRLGVEIADALQRRRVLVPTDSGWEVRADRLSVGPLEIDIDTLRHHRRPLLRACLDWSERRPHVAGALGAALADALFELRWIERRPDTRALRVTSVGIVALQEVFEIDLAAPSAPQDSIDFA